MGIDNSEKWNPNCQKHMKGCLTSREENAKCKIGSLFRYIWEWQNLKPDNAKYWQGCKDKRLSHSADGKVNLYKHKEKPIFCKLDCVYLTI